MELDFDARMDKDTVVRQDGVNEDKQCFMSWNHKRFMPYSYFEDIPMWTAIKLLCNFKTCSLPRYNCCIRL
jgi:hypothetical protein